MGFVCSRINGNEIKTERSFGSPAPLRAAKWKQCTRSEGERLIDLLFRLALNEKCRCLWTESGLSDPSFADDGGAFDGKDRRLGGQNETTCFVIVDYFLLLVASFSIKFIKQSNSAFCLQIYLLNGNRFELIVDSIQNETCVSCVSVFHFGKMVSLGTNIRERKKMYK